MALRLLQIMHIKYRTAMPGRLIHWLDTMIGIPMHVGMRTIPPRVVGTCIDASRVVGKSIIPSRVTDLSAILSSG
jgi:hypothetical protein